MILRSRPSAAAILILVALAGFTAWITWRAKVLETRLATRGEAIALTGKAAPDFTLRSVDDRTVSLSEFRGKRSVVISFWASWCGPCRAEMPALAAFYEKTHKADSEFEVLAISIDESVEAARDAAKEWKMPFPVLLDSAHEVADAFGVEGIPTVFIVDKAGKVAYGHVGYEMGMEIAIAQTLGVPYQPSFGATDDAGRH